ncbi:hydrogenase [Caldimonas thermodepolymerans]|uniref:Hydrogenase n=2 Tax=Caldimonas thermodepolymerans TaxID=215580 RepID=A0A2S5T5B1_9BURK|nr:hydrogenase [Caldimonas thermodepolymerans]QPC31824.1 hydrogenase [Caldimonas thermodepolymerans]RDI01670.1 hydrogenase-1 operon protein HyaE [Caldimonas thermodepolymerans]
MTMTATQSLTPPAAALAIPPLIERLASAPGGAWVNDATLDAFLAEPGVAVIFLWGDPVRFPECLDVAVVLPELLKAVRAAGGPGWRTGVVEPQAEMAVDRRYGASRRPALVFLRDGGYLGTVGGMLDWDVFLAEVQRVLAAPVTRAPSIGIPVRAAASDGGCH